MKPRVQNIVFIIVLVIEGNLTNAEHICWKGPIVLSKPATRNSKRNKTPYLFESILERLNLKLLVKLR